MIIIAGGEPECVVAWLAKQESGVYARIHYVSCPEGGVHVMHFM